MAIDLELPWPPSENGAYDVSPVLSGEILGKLVFCYQTKGSAAAIRLGMMLIRGGWRLGKRGREYCQDVAHIVAQKGGIDTLTGPLQVVHDFTPPDNRRRDLYNHHKVLHDALTKAGVWGDDSQIVQGTDYWHAPKKPGLVRVVIEELS